MRKLLAFTSSAALALVAPAAAQELSLAYFMGPGHPENAGVFTPFGEWLEEASRGAVNVRQHPSGALNGSPPDQYSVLLDSFADIVFALPTHTADVFPMTNGLAIPGICNSAVSCTEAVQPARFDLETASNALVLAMWSLAPFQRALRYSS